LKEYSEMLSRRFLLAAFGLALVAGTFAWAGPRAAFLVLIGLGFGLVLEGLRFGFAGPWRAVVAERDARGLVAQLLAIGAAAALALPLLAAAPGELAGAHAPVGVGMILGAFIFGAAMQVALGCGSGTLVNAGSGNLIGLVALVGFIGGSFAGTLHLGFWTALGALPVITLQGVAGNAGGTVLTLAGLGIVGYAAIRHALPGKRLPPLRLWVAAGLIAALAVLNLVVAGQPWGIVYGLGLWGAKLVEAGGADLAATAYWSAPANAERLAASLMTDVTSLTNIGLIAGAFLAMRWRRLPDAPATSLTPPSWAAVLLAGLVLGYSARMAFGCNVGAFFSGISTGSLHGWVWFAAAFAGSTLGLKLRPWLLIPRTPVAMERPA